MVLNYIWIAFLLIAFAAALYATITTGDTAIWGEIMGASFDQAAFAFEISIGLTGVARPMARHNEDRGEGWCHGAHVPYDITTFHPSLSRDSQGASRFRGHIHEHFCQYARPRQRRHADGSESHAGDADPEPSKGHRHRRADHVPGAQRLRPVPHTHQHHDVQGAGGSLFPHRCLHPHTDRHGCGHPRGACGPMLQAAHTPGPRARRLGSAPWH